MVKTVTYLTDGETKRAAKLVNGVVKSYFIHDKFQRLIAELNPDYMINNGETLYYIKDQLGSILQVVNSAGVIRQELDYDLFGGVAIDSNPGFQPFGFAGAHYDFDTGLVRFGARDYAADIGRWVERDPILFNGGSTNLYAYAFNDPINVIDPSGLRSDMNLTSYNDPAGQAAEFIPNMAGAYTITGHGNAFQIGNQLGVPLTPENLVAILRLDSTYVAGQTVVLQSCATGANSSGFAQQLSSILGAQVWAPNDSLYPSAGPNPGDSNVGKGADAKWNSFAPSPVPLK